MKLAFVGLGAMGLPMARNLAKAGFEVVGYDASPKASAAFAGATAASAAAAASGAEAILLMVVNAAQAESVLFEGGALDTLAPSGVVIVMATCPPGAVKALAAKVAARGRGFVDAPVSGGVVGAEASKLTIMVGADTATFERARAVLSVLGDKVFHVGEPGQGAAVKAINQLFCGVHIAVAAEGLSLARKMGVDPAKILEICGGSAAASWMLNNRGPRMVQDEPEVASAVDIFVKDLGIVLEAGRETKAALPLAALAHQLFVSTSGRGDGAADDSQVIRAYAKLNGM